ncbi:unnamed protein product [Effrenium voratum]|nr:unnamed protein product [Effrenium voratum]
MIWWRLAGMMLSSLTSRRPWTKQAVKPTGHGKQHPPKVRSAFLPYELPMDEFDCYNEAFIAANGIPVNWTRHWFFQLRDPQVGLPEIWNFFISWMQVNAPRLFAFSLRV